VPPDKPRIPGFPLLPMAARYWQGMLSNVLAERWKPDAARHFQTVTLRRMIRHVYAHVPFYRAHFRRAGVRPEDIRCADNLRLVPPVSREELLRAGDDAIDRRFPRRRLMHDSTSGTSGSRLSVDGLPEEVAALGGYMWSFFVAAGVRPTDRILTVASRHVRWLPPPWRCTWLDRKRPLSEWMDAFFRKRPTVVIGQTEGIVMIAAELIRRGARPRGPVRKVFPFGWTLAPEFRTAIREGLGVEPHDCYGTMETIWVGRECARHQGFHIPRHRLIVEAVHPEDPRRSAHPGRPGELLLTDLARTTTPFIRYRIGDIGEVTESPCLCGRPGPRVVNLLGRSMDILVTIDGRPIGVGWLQLYQQQLAGVLRDFRFVQESPGQCTLQWVAGARWSPEAMQRIRDTIRAVLGPVTIREERLDGDIPPEATGKLRRVARTFPIPEGTLSRLGDSESPAKRS
jgi:phenylacetate-CoA ligase